MDGLDRASLRRVWEQTFGATPPHSLSHVFLLRVLLHEHQRRTYGGHSVANRRALAAMANGTPSLAARTGSVSAGAKRILLPMASVGDISTIPGELFAKFQTSFYSDPRDAAFKSLGVD